ncbi:NADPH2:quinone reductase [Actinocorallia herbida]|uniref:NADPH2:quinone reductase n=1 Tax=Actinocorallia herbida TaxID=58109 RepID=A0A3N1CYF8_9ACTN|nr:zinc-binding dehydrogenase [Actinocorallia herbida]ROO86327.1 NADPH2:quinone reductase [Actinocorallia herbida]
MRKIEVKEFGGPEVLEPAEGADLRPGAGEVVVRVEAVDVLFVEAVIRYGLATDHFSFTPPYVPGGGVSGRVERVGADVDRAWEGRRVCVRTDGGGYADQVAAPAQDLIPVPDGLGIREAAALLHDGVTALGVLDAARITEGERVLVTAAAGGMGILTVQRAVAAGAVVVGAARGGAKLRLIESFGAYAVDYSPPDWAERAVEALGGRPDVVLDGAGTSVGRAAFAVVADGGRFSAHGAPSGGFAEVDAAEAARRGITLRGIADVQFTPEEIRALVRRAFAEGAAGRLRPVIGQLLPLERAADAHRALEARATVGKTLLLP